MKIPLALFILAQLLVASALATPKCTTTEWAANRNLPLKVFKSTLDKTPRNQIIQMAWGEILRQKPDSVAFPLLQYLANTETNKDLRGYYLTMGMMLNPGVDLSDTVKTWPKRPAHHDSLYSLQELCDLHQKSEVLK